MPRLLFPLLLLPTLLIAAEPPLQITPAGLRLNLPAGQPATRPVTLRLADRPRRWTASTDAPWLTLSHAEGDGSVARMTPRLAIGPLPAGAHAARVTVTLSGDPAARVDLPVSVTVHPLKTLHDVGGRKQVFLDRRFIESAENITLKINPPRKLGPALDAGGKPLPADHVLCVLEHGGKFRLYHGVERVRLYESTDGIHWTPDGRVDIPIDFGTLLVDDRDVPQRRYKMFGSVQFEGRPTERFDPATGGIYAYTSADGISFKRGPRVLPMWIDNPLIPYFDDRIGRYVVFGRAQAAPTNDGERRGGVENQRRVFRVETDDLLAPWPFDQRFPPDHWRYLLTNNHVPEVLKADERDYRWSDFYYNAATPYPYADDAWLMFPAAFGHFKYTYHNQLKPRKPGEWEDYGLIEIQLAVSRDGIHWDRPERAPYVPIGRPDEWDRFLLTPAPGLIRKGDDLLQYYTSTGHTHDSNTIRPDEYADRTPRKGGIGILQQRLDGFVSADAPETGGWLLTPPIVFSGKRLRLNIDTGAVGFAQVELRDAADGKPIPGFELQQCEEVIGNYTDYYVQWKSTNDVSSLAGKPVRLYFKMTRAKLFAFQFTDK